MKEEIKEINIPENVLVALGDLTNGALNYYKATETVKVRHNTILNYITNLQEENKNLKDLKYFTTIEIYDELEKRLKDMANMIDELSNKYYDKQEAVDKAVEFIEEKISSTKGVINDYMYHKEHNKILIELLQEDIELYKKELNILKGDKDE